MCSFWFGVFQSKYVTTDSLGMKHDMHIMFEEAGFYGEDGFRYVNGRQTELLLIPRVRLHQGN